MNARLMLRSVLCVAAMSVAPGPIASAIPTTLPELLSPADMKALAAIAREMNKREWGPAVVETFEKAPAKETWKMTQGGTLEYKDGKLLVRGQANMGQSLVTRAIPEELRGSEGIRIDAWVQPLPRTFPGQNMVANYQNTLLLGTSLNPYQFQYQFANSVNGNVHQIQANELNLYQAAQIDMVQPGKTMHVALEVLPRQVRCERDKNALLKQDVDLLTGFKLSAESRIGFLSYGTRFAVVQVAYRGLAPLKNQDFREEWKKAPFADQKALTDFLGRTAIPQLDDPKYLPRDAATQLLTAIYPLSKPALQAVDGKTRTPEGQLRISSLLNHVPPVQMATTRPEDIKDPVAADLPEDEKTDKPNPPTTQPVGGGMKGMPMPMPLRMID